MGDSGAAAVEDIIRNSRRPEAGIAATGVALVTLLLGASGVFVELKGALNIVWNVKPEAGIGATVKSRLAAFALVLAVGFLLLVSLLVSAALSALGVLLGRYVPPSTWLLELMNGLVSFAVITVLFAMLFKYLPDTAVSWRDVGPGAGVTSLLFGVGKYLIGLYLARKTVTSAYGAAASLVVVMIWVYWAAQIFFFGAELTQACARYRLKNGRQHASSAGEPRSRRQFLDFSAQASRTAP